MTLREEDLHACAFLAGKEIDLRREMGAPIPAWLRRLQVRVALERVALADSGQGFAVPEPDSDVIGVEEAARILGCSVRTARRLAADLEGRRTGRAWIFRRAVVEEYAAARSDHDERPVRTA